VDDILGKDTSYDAFAAVRRWLWAEGVFRQPPAARLSKNIPSHYANSSFRPSR
jgi:hypothetical protein